MLSFPDQTVDAPRLERLHEAVDTLWSYAFLLATELAVVGVTAGWILLWGATVRLHYSKGHVVDAGLTTLLLILPAVGIFAWRLTRKLEGNGLPALG